MKSIFAVAVLFIAGTHAVCTLSELDAFIDSGRKCPIFRELADCPAGLTPLQSLNNTDASKCCITCREKLCTDQQITDCRTSYASLPECARGAEPTFANCCPSCRKIPRVLDCVRNDTRTRDQRLTEFLALPQCSLLQRPRFNTTTCEFNCRRPARSVLACSRLNREPIRKCIRDAPLCEPGAVRQQRVCGAQAGDCCCSCRFGVNTCESMEEQVACRKEQRTCALDEWPSKASDESCCASCRIGRPECTPACSAEQRCAWRFNSTNAQAREGRCVIPLARRVCIRAVTALQTRLEGYTDEELSAYVSGLVESYCAQSNATACEDPERLANFILNLEAEKLEKARNADANEFCMNLRIAKRADSVLDDSTTSTRKRASLQSTDEEDLNFVETVMNSEYIADAEGIEGTTASSGVMLAPMGALLLLCLVFAFFF